MLQRIIAIGFIFACIAIAWIVLGQTVHTRTQQQDKKLKSSVGQLWGTTQTQKTPVVYWTEKRPVLTQGGDKAAPAVQQIVHKDHPIPLQESKLEVALQLEHRRKGLLWYPTYRVDFTGTYMVANDAAQPRDLFFKFTLPAPNAVYDDFRLELNDEPVGDVQIAAGGLVYPLHLSPGQQAKIKIAYSSQGMDEWGYSFGVGVNQVSNFTLEMLTDFAAIDFPQQSISPTHKEKTADGWKLVWHYDNLLTGVNLGMVLPEKLNPGPWVSQVSFAAPISLFLFFFLLFVFTTIREIKLHPMNYFFIGAAFFSFHLLLAYLVDHISIHQAFLSCSAVSIFLVISYMRLVVGQRFAFVEVALAQFVYLVLFSYTFFFEGYTGLAITLLCISTLFAVMQFTGKVDWEDVFRQEQSRGAKPSLT